MTRNIAGEALDGLKELSNYIAVKVTNGVTATVSVEPLRGVRAMPEKPKP
jgi:hypothetical protein